MATKQSCSLDIFDVCGGGGLEDWGWSGGGGVVWGGSQKNPVACEDKYSHWIQSSHLCCWPLPARLRQWHQKGVPLKEFRSWVKKWEKEKKNSTKLLQCSPGYRWCSGGSSGAVHLHRPTIKAEFIAESYRWEGYWSWMCKLFNQPLYVHVCGISHGGHHGRLWWWRWKGQEVKSP